MGKISGYEKVCEIESSNLTNREKSVAWAIQECMASVCEAECWPGHCGCAITARDKALSISKELYE